jgi:hypothetical protein
MAMLHYCCVVVSIVGDGVSFVFVVAINSKVFQSDHRLSRCTSDGETQKNRGTSFAYGVVRMPVRRHLAFAITCIRSARECADFRLTMNASPTILTVAIVGDAIPPLVKSRNPNPKVDRQATANELQNNLSTSHQRHIIIRSYHQRKKSKQPLNLSTNTNHYYKRYHEEKLVTRNETAMAPP